MEDMKTGMINKENNLSETHYETKIVRVNNRRGGQRGGRRNYNDRN